MNGSIRQVPASFIASFTHCMSTCVSGSVQCSFIVVIVMIMVDLLNVELVLGKGDG